ncbi:hypothetical protein MSKU9_0363 [Komagataeibacter diospyri]|uniref:GST N-terminal domain-containing protein n=2 Tax=Komagataeibacter diospyri TaxID=1932662 RepID=A0A4V0WM28_9PROT|nr:hypothetical protein MSKU9_0363 [Komagataeibacter diospyri]
MPDYGVFLYHVSLDRRLPNRKEMTARPVLYSFRRCPYAMRARLALLSSGMECEIREVRLSAKPASMLRASPKATVPVFVLPDHTVVDESLDIMCWDSMTRSTGCSISGMT